MLGPTKIRIGTWATRPAASTLFRTASLTGRNVSSPLSSSQPPAKRRSVDQSSQLRFGALIALRGELGGIGTGELSTDGKFSDICLTTFVWLVTFGHFLEKGKLPFCPVQFLV